MSESEERTGIDPQPVTEARCGVEEDEPPGTPRRHPLWRDVPARQWDDWRWQSQNAIRSVRQLRGLLHFSPDELAAIGSLEAEYKTAIPPYYFSLIDPDDPAWVTADWKEVLLPGGPPNDWASGLPGGRFPEQVSHLDLATGRPLTWPLPFSWAAWEVRLGVLEAWSYEFRVRAVDLNGFAQPEPRPNPQSGIAEVPCMTFNVA